ncbi:MAG: MlaC/ttg2D family ABC transporter substrate-binding protein [Gammaproteobacteria bacterium]
MNYRVITLAISLLFAPYVSATAQEAHEVVNETVEIVIERIKTEQEMLQAQPERVFEVVNDLVLPRFDFNFMSRAVLGKSAWKSSSAQQHTEFAAQFTNLLVRTYGKALLSYVDQTSEYLETIAKPGSDIVLVKTQIRHGNGDITPVDYWLRRSNSGWKVINVSFQGVNLIKTYRQSFASEIKNNGMDSLIQKLADKNEKLAGSVIN